MKKLELLLLAAGATMLYLIVRRMDFEIVRAGLCSAGVLGFGFIFLQEIGAHIFNTLGWKYCFTPETSSKISFWETAKSRVAGDGINYLTPSATLAGEWARTAMIAKELPFETRLASVAVAKITQAIAMAVISILGIILAVKTKIKLDNLSSYIEGGSWLFLAIIAGIAILEIRTAKFRANNPQEKARGLFGKLKNTDRLIMLFLKENPGRFFASIFMFFCAYMWGTIEAYFICKFLGYPVGAGTAVLIEFLSVFMDGLFFAVPAKAGTQEATKTAIFTALGYNPAVGFSFAVIRHLREILWASCGFALYYLAKNKTAATTT